tara:strand:- start:1894 stop:2280 length:387 start_codon:yes stop_codon:yes gene_type:complete
MSELSNKDYLSILSFYNLRAPKKKGKINYKKVKTIAENILAEKLCRCIKKVAKSPKPSKKAESRAAAICGESVIKKKGLKHNRFKCKKKPQLLSGSKKHKLLKTAKHVKNKKARKNRRARRTRRAKNI